MKNKRTVSIVAGCAILIILIVIAFAVKNSGTSDDKPAATAKPAVSATADAGSEAQAGPDAEVTNAGADDGAGAGGEAATEKSKDKQTGNDGDGDDDDWWEELQSNGLDGGDDGDSGSDDNWWEDIQFIEGDPTQTDENGEVVTKSKENVSEAYPGQADGWSPIVSPDDLK